MFAERQLDVDPRDEETGMTLLHIACQMDRKATVSSLVQKKASVFKISRTGKTALHYAVQAGSIDCARSLLHGGAPPNVADNGKCTPMHYATTPNMAMYLAGFGARPDLSDLKHRAASRLVEDTFTKTKNEAGKKAFHTAMAEACEKFGQRKSVVGDGKKGRAQEQWVDDNALDKCMLCTVEFSMFNRRHHCRICGSLICGACSSKTTTLPSGEEVRTCDSCYNHNCFKYDLRRKAQRTANRSTRLKEQARLEKTNAYNERMKAKVAQMSATRARIADPDKSKSKSKNPAVQKALDTAEARRTMRENVRLMEERGEKLDELNERASRMEDNSRDFAAMAKKLRQKQESSWF
jgi:hypothetical protein